MTDLKPGDRFPDIEQPDQADRPTCLSRLGQAGALDRRRGFDGYPLVVVFYRGVFSRATSSGCSCWFSSSAAAW